MLNPKHKTWLMVCMPSILAALYFLSIALFHQDSTYKEENKVTKPVVLLVVGNECPDCKSQEKTWKEFIQKSDYPVEYKKVTLDDPIFADTSRILNIQSLPAIVTMSDKGLVTSSVNGLVTPEELNRLSAVALESKLPVKEEN